MVTDAKELCDVADIPIEVEFGCRSLGCAECDAASEAAPDAFEWPEDAQTDAERATHLAEVVACHLELPEADVAAYRAWLLGLAEKLEAAK